MLKDTGEGCGKKLLTIVGCVVLLIVILVPCPTHPVIPGVTTNDGRPCYSEYEGCGVPTPYPTRPW
jgi:hypothetical protein